MTFIQLWNGHAKCEKCSATVLATIDAMEAHDRNAHTEPAIAPRWRNWEICVGGALGSRHVIYAPDLTTAMQIMRASHPTEDLHWTGSH